MEKNIPPKHVIEARQLAERIGSLELCEQNSFVLELISSLSETRKHKLRIYAGHTAAIDSHQEALIASLKSLQ